MNAHILSRQEVIKAEKFVNSKLPGEEIRKSKNSFTVWIYVSKNAVDKRDDRDNEGGGRLLQLYERHVAGLCGEEEHMLCSEVHAAICFWLGWLAPFVLEGVYSDQLCLRKIGSLHLLIGHTRTLQAFYSSSEHTRQRDPVFSPLLIRARTK